MASTQPLICTSLHLPPDLQPFQRIHDVSLEVFLPNLDRLRLALEATQDVNPEATQIFYETRKAIREELRTLFGVPHGGAMLAERYLTLLEALSKKNPTQRPFYNVNLGAGAGMLSSKEAQEAISVFRKELNKAVDAVVATAGVKNKKGSKSSLASAENTQLVSEIFNAIDECHGLLQQCHEQFEKVSEQTQDQNSLELDPPSEEEIQVIRAKWQTFFKSAGGLWVHGFEIADEIIMPSSDIRQRASERRKHKQKVPLWRALFQRKDQQDLVRSENVPEVSEEPSNPGATAVTPSGSHEIRTSVINEVDVTEGPGTSESAEVPSATPANDPTSNNSKAPFWQKVFRRNNRDNSNPPPDATSGPETSDGARDIPAPPAKVTFWRKFSRYAPCVSTTPFR